MPSAAQIVLVGAAVGAAGFFYLKNREGKGGDTATTGGGFLDAFVEGASMTSAVQIAIPKGFEKWTRNGRVKTSADLLPGANFRRVKQSNMASVPRDLVNHPNVRAAFGMIRWAEGTYGSDGYRKLFGGKLFSSYADHPRMNMPFYKDKNGKQFYSTAAGAYQAMVSTAACPACSNTWDDTASEMGLPDFSPERQDLFALGRIAFRGVLPAVLDGDIVYAINPGTSRGHGLCWEWASLPGHDYGNQAVKKMDDLVRYFQINGGVRLPGT